VVNFTSLKLFDKMKNIFHLILFSFLVLFLLQFCKKETITIPKNKIVLIFNERTYEKDTLKIGQVKSYRQLPPINYTIEGSYLNYVITPRNINKTDTIIIRSSKNIILSHQYHYYYNSTFIIKPMDTIIFNYINDAPYAKKTSSNSDLNFEVKYDLNHKVYESDMEYLIKNDRYRTKKELNNYKNILIDNIKTKRNYFKILTTKKRITNKSLYYLKNKFLLEYYNLLPLDSIRKKNIKFSNDSLLSLPIYRAFVSKFSIKNFKIKMIKSSQATTIDAKSLFDSILNSQLFSKKIRNYLLYKNLKQIITNYPQQDAEIYLNKFKEKVNDSTLINNLKHTYLLDFNKLKKETRNVNLINLKKEQQTLKKIINSNKGKLIYIDFWASWCAPCRAAMPSSRKLHNDYKNKDVTFVYISIDKDFNKWEKASEEENLTFDKYNLLSINYPLANFYKELKLNTIPRYLLYDKKGKLVYQNAPGPKDKDTRLLLNKYLKK